MRAGKCVSKGITAMRAMGLLFVVLLLATGIAKAQGTATGAISGTVNDASGAVIGDAAVQVRNVGTGQARSITTDGQGRYRVPELGIGDYEITAAKMGFNTERRTGITLTVGSNLVIDFQLPVGQQTQTVTVEGQASTVETQSTALGVLVESKQIRELPLNGRNFTQLIALNPGVTQIPQGALGAGSGFYGNGTKYSIAGSRPSGQNYLLDGTDLTSFWNAGPGASGLGTALGIEGIAEFQTLTNTYSAQFGGNGAVINASSRPGTNAFHGSAYEFLRNNVLETRNVFDDQRPPYRQNQFGGSLGGPIKRNKAFFFVNDEGLRKTKITTIPNQVVPDARGIPTGPNAGVYTLGNGTTVAENANSVTRQAIRNILPFWPAIQKQTAAQLAAGVGITAFNRYDIGTENYLLGRLDYNFSEKSSLFLRYTLDRGDLDTSGSTNGIPWWPDRHTTRSHFLTLEERQILTPRLVNLARVSFTRPAEDGNLRGSPIIQNGVPQLSPDFGTGNTALHPFSFLPGRADGGISIGGGGSGGGAGTILNPGPAGPLPFYLTQNRFGYADDIIWTSGTHSIKAGASAIRYREATWMPHSAGGSWAFNDLASFLGGNAASVNGQISDQQNPAGDGVRDYRYWVFGFYIDDQWKIHPKLTVNLGLRYSPLTKIGGVRHQFYNLLNPPFGDWVPTEYTTNVNPSLKNWDPRVGLAWDPFPDHKTSIRAGFGIFHSPVLSRELLGGFQPPLVQGVQTTSSNPPIQFPFMYTNFPNLPPGSPLVIPKTGTLSVRQAGDNWLLATTPYQIQWNFNIQRELINGGVLTVGYVGSRSVHLFFQRDFNPPALDSLGRFGTPTLLSPTRLVVVARPRLNPAYSFISIPDEQAFASYHALQTSFSKRFSKNWQSQVSYTWSKSLDNASGTYGLDGSIGAGGEIQPYNPRYTYGPSNFSRKHNFRASGTYEIPFQGNGALGKLIQGWAVTGIYSYLSGNPFSPAPAAGSVYSGGPTPALGQADAVAGCKVYPDNQTRTNWFNPGCFAMPTLGLYGHAQRNSLVGPNLWVMDASLIKDTRIPAISEQFSVQFRAEVFNLLNHPSFQNPQNQIFSGFTTTGAGVLNPLAGVILATNSQPRQIQLALKIVF